MVSNFSRTLSLLRQEKGFSQRKVAKDLGVSQALLSHYENGIREPGLSFVVKACEYYGVSADFILGRSMARNGAMIKMDDLEKFTPTEGEPVDAGKLSTYYKKLLANSEELLYNLLAKTEDEELIRSLGDFHQDCIYAIARLLLSRSPSYNEQMFSLPEIRFICGDPRIDSEKNMADFVYALNRCESLPRMDNLYLEKTFPGMYQCLLQIIHSTESRLGCKDNEGMDTSCTI